MELKKEKNNFNISLRKIKYKKIILMLLFLLILGISSLLSIYYGAIHKDELRILYEETPHRIEDISNWVKGKFSNPEKIYIDINYKNYMKLAYLREKALEGIMLSRSPNDTVPATIRYKGKTLKADIRLKGDWVGDHLTGEKWSFRIKIKGNETLFSMKEFSIQRAGSRNFIYEWVFHKSLKKEGLIGLKYEFIDVTLNGNNLGIYALEEHFDKLTIESNDRREGPIIKINENLARLTRLERPYYFSLNEEFITTDIYMSSMIEPFNPNRLSKNPELTEQFYKARDLFELFRRGELKTSDVFDIEKYATFMALSDLMGGGHGQYFENVRFYYNPITSKLEPIGYDASTGRQISSLIFYPPKDMAYNNGLLMKQLFQDKIFLEKYIQELERISNKKYLDNFLKDIDDELQENQNIIYKDHPNKKFNKEILYKNQQFIIDVLNPVEGIYAYYKNINNDILEVYIGNLQQIPIVILNADYKKNILTLVSNNTFLESKDLYLPVHYETFKFKIPKEMDVQDIKENLNINYKLLGKSEIRTKKVIPWPYLDKNSLEEDSKIKKPNIESFDFIKVDNSSKTISMETGEWNIDKNIIIPEGYIVYFNKGTTLNFLGNSKIISYSPLKFKGTEESPIKIKSGSLVVLNSKESSLLEYVIFQNSSEAHENKWKLTGSITFYESPVIISYSRFSNSNSEDFINIIRSEFEIRNSFFENSYSDMLDIDFGEGIISSSSFINCSNDCLDLSGSDIILNKISINGAGDKGISAGENTKLDAKDISIKNSRIGIASKDLSFITIENIEISDSEYGFACYKKKSEFGPSEMHASTIKLINTDNNYIVEEESKLLINQKEIKEKVISSEIASLNFW